MIITLRRSSPDAASCEGCRHNGGAGAGRFDGGEVDAELRQFFQQHLQGVAVYTYSRDLPSSFHNSYYYCSDVTALIIANLILSASLLHQIKLLITDVSNRNLADKLCFVDVSYTLINSLLY